MNYIRKTYNVPAKRGGRVKFNGDLGTILSARHGWLRLRLDGESYTADYHPTWMIEYL